MFNKAKRKEVIKKIDKQTNNTKFWSSSETDRAAIPVEHKKTQLQLKAKPKPIKDIYPTSHVFTIKIIGARGMGQKIFLLEILNSFLKEKIIKRSDIVIFSPTYNNQPQGIESGFQQKDFKYLREDLAANKLLVSDDMQTDVRGNKLIADFFTWGRHNKLGIIQWEQFTQDTACLENVNTDCFVLVTPFTEYAAHYYHEESMPLLSARQIVKLGLDASARASEENNPELRHITINKSGQILFGYTYNVCPFEDGNKYEILIDWDKTDIYPYIEN